MTTITAKTGPQNGMLAMWNRRAVRAAVGVCALGLAVVLGGCNNAIKDENAALQAENAELRTKSTSLEQQQAATQAQIAQLQAQIAAAQAPAAPAAGGDFTGGDTGARTRSRGGSERVIDVIAGDLLFASGQATIRSEARRELDKVAREIQSRHAGRTIRIKGYTDSDPIRKSRWPSNEALSEARAEAVATYLVSKGVSRSIIETMGMGAANPRATKAQSRRVEIVVVE